MNDQCTILIPTHNRPNYLQRCVRWFLGLGYGVVVVDSSTDAWVSELRDHAALQYIHHPGGFEVYLKKIQMGLAAVKTPLVAMCADDDFITGAGLEESIAFLMANPDYAFCQGYSYCFQTFDSRMVIWPVHYRSHDVTADSWLDRVELAKDTLYYGVHRTTVLRTAIDFLAERDFSETFNSAIGFFDWCLIKATARAGKLKRVPVPFGLREYSAIVSVVGTRFRTITSRNIPDFYAASIPFLLKDDTSETARVRLLKLASMDYAGQLSYDMQLGSSRKDRLAFLPGWLVTECEYLFRLFSALRMFWTKGFRGCAKVFWMPEYRRFRDFVLPPRKATAKSSASKG